MSIHPVSKEDIETLRYIASDVLQPLYGDQTKAFREWLTGEGFKQAFIMKNDEGIPQAFVSLKINPSKDYIKVSTFFVMPNSRGNGIGKELLAWVLDYTLSETVCRSLKVTVSEDKSESLVFFQKNGFQVIDQIEGKYVEGKTEFILQKEVNRDKVS
jgi:GNAT superfamily N-acetyltransferase